MVGRTHTGLRHAAAWFSLLPSLVPMMVLGYADPHRFSKLVTPTHSTLDLASSRASYPEKVVIQRYDPKTGQPTVSEIHEPGAFLPRRQ